LKEKLATKKAVLEVKYQRMAQAKARIQDAKNRREDMKKAIDEMVQKLSQAKNDLD